MPGPDNGLPARLDNSQQRTTGNNLLAGEPAATDQGQLQEMSSLNGARSGKSLQLAFHGPDFVVVQPSEGRPVMSSS